MGKKITVFILAALLTLTLISCTQTGNEIAKTEGQSTQSETATPAPTPEPTPEPTPTPEPPPVITDVFASYFALYTGYSNGELDYLGDLFELEQWDVDSYIERKLIELDIPVIVDFSQYSNTPEFDYEVLDKATVDMEAYNAQYGEQIAKLEDAMYMEYQGVPKTITKIVSNGRKEMIIYDTEDNEGLVLANIGADYRYRVDGRTQGATSSPTRTYSLFEGSQIVDAAIGDYMALGLKSDGTVVSFQSPELMYMMENKKVLDADEYVFHDFSGWTNIVDIAADENFALGVKRDGTVVSFGLEKTKYAEAGQWTDIASITIMNDMILGLKSDGTVISTNPDAKLDFSSWTGVTELKASGDAVYGLRNDGKIYYATATKVSYGFYVQEDYVVNNVIDWDDIVSADMSSYGLIALTGDGQAKYMPKQYAHFYIEDFNSGVLDAVTVNNMLYAVKKEGGAMVAGTEYTPKYPDDAEKDWEELYNKNYKKKDFETGVLISGNMPRNSNILRITAEGVLEYEETMYNEVFTYEHREKIIDAVSLQGSAFSRRYILALSESGDVIILNTNSYTNNQMSGVYREGAVDMDSLSQMLAAGSSAGFLYNDGKFVTLPELGMMNYVYINSYADDEIKKLNEFSGADYKSTDTIKNGTDDASSAQNNDGPKSITWNEFVEALGMEPPKYENGSYEYGQHYENYGFYDYTFTGAAEDKALEYIEQIKEIPDVEFITSHEETGIIRHGDGSEENFNYTVFDFSYNGADSGKIVFAIELNYYSEDDISLRIRVYE